MAGCHHDQLQFDAANVCDTTFLNVLYSRTALRRDVFHAATGTGAGRPLAMRRAGVLRLSLRSRWQHGAASVPDRRGRALQGVLSRAEFFYAQPLAYQKATGGDTETCAPPPCQAPMGCTIHGSGPIDFFLSHSTSNSANCRPLYRASQPSLSRALRGSRRLTETSSGRSSDSLVATCSLGSSPTEANAASTRSLSVQVCPVAMRKSSEASCCNTRHIASAYSDASPQSRWIETFPKVSFSSLPFAIRTAVATIFLQTNLSGRIGAS